ncbi:MAG: GNAT family N-acetyltransferase [Hyphomicrobiaceae bacterium]|nr:GNAT family N-acetyltransferase [Hyphomicrobiaceae bacterium]
MPLTFRPLTAKRWPDLVDLFGPERGANSGCWCMWPRLARSEWNALGKDGRKRRFAAIVKKGPPPGLLAYEDGKAIGWVAVGPRISVARFNQGRTSKPTDGAGDPDPDKTYAISCFYTRTGHRKQGLMEELAKAATEHARKQGAEAIEACAIEPDKPLQWGEGFVGLATVFRRLGFDEVARRSPKRPLMRLDFRV